MAGRNAKPVGLHVAEGNPNRLTKAEIQKRKDAEIKLGGARLKCPDYVKADPVALKKWRELVRDYTAAAAAGVDLVKSSDIGILARYCKTFSEYQELLKAYQRVSEIHYDCAELDDFISELDEDGQRILAYKVQKQLRDLFSINGILTIESAINKKMDQLVKMEDRLFLNPLAKVKNVPKKETDKKPESKFAKFGGAGARA